MTSLDNKKTNRVFFWTSLLVVLAILLIAWGFWKALDWTLEFLRQADRPSRIETPAPGPTIRSIPSVWGEEKG